MYEQSVRGRWRYAYYKIKSKSIHRDCRSVATVKKYLWGLDGLGGFQAQAIRGSLHDYIISDIGG